MHLTIVSKIITMNVPGEEGGCEGGARDGVGGKESRVRGGPKETRSY